MRILWLGTSNDIPSAAVPEALWTTRLMEPRLAALLGEPVEITARALWPTPDVDEVVGRWADLVEPDPVYIKINKFWYMHESIPLHIERALGPLGKPLRRLTLGANGTPWLAPTVCFTVSGSSPRITSMAPTIWSRTRWSNGFRGPCA